MRKESSQSAPRRTRVKGHPGVFVRESARGRRYEITFVGSDGRRRWQTIDGRLADADAALAKVKTQLHAGERIQPTTATVDEIAGAWLATLGELRPRTVERYAANVRLHVSPRIGRLRIAALTEDHVARLVAEMREQGYAAWTIRGVLVAVSRLCSFAVRRGQLSANPVSRLERHERPRVERREQRILSTEELAALLAHAVPTYRPLLAMAALTGLRLSELLGLVWSEVDFEESVVRVRRQLDRGGQRAPLKSPAAARDVLLVDSLTQLLRVLRDEARAARPVPLDRERDFVFATETGSPRGHRNVEQRGLDKAAERASLIPPKDKRKWTEADAVDTRTLRFHDLRHLFASMLIAQGADVVFVSRQLGHADPSITLRVYAHLFAARTHAERTRALLQAAVGNVLETPGCEGQRTGPVPEVGNVAQLRAPATSGD